MTQQRVTNGSRSVVACLGNTSVGTEVDVYVR